MKITAYDELYPLRLALGDTALSFSSGSNSAEGDISGGGDVVGEPGDYTVVGLRSMVSLSSNIGGGTVGDVLTIVQASPRLAAFATPSNSALTIEEADASPTVSATKLVFPNGTLGVVGTVATYTPAAGAGAIAESLIDAKGDLIVGSAADTAARLAVGSNGYVLTADSAEATGVKWAAPLTAIAITYVIDGGGVAITTGVKGDLRIPFACTVTAWTILADASGAIVVDVWRDAYANFPPTDADAMPGAGKEPTIAASGVKAEDTTVTDWTDYTIDAGDVLRFNVDSCTAITRATIVLTATRT